NLPRREQSPLKRAKACACAASLLDREVDGDVDRDTAARWRRELPPVELAEHARGYFRGAHRVVANGGAAHRSVRSHLHADGHPARYGVGPECTIITALRSRSGGSQRRVQGARRLALALGAARPLAPSGGRRFAAVGSRVLFLDLGWGWRGVET